MKLTKTPVVLIGILLTVSIVACSNRAGNKWPAEQRNEFLTSCVGGATSSGGEVFSEAKAKSYCNCTLEVIESRYWYEDLEDKWLSAVQELEKDGTIRSCMQKAGIPIP